MSGDRHAKRRRVAQRGSERRRHTHADMVTWEKRWDAYQPAPSAALTVREPVALEGEVLPPGTLEAEQLDRVTTRLGESLADRARALQDAVILGGGK